MKNRHDDREILSGAREIHQACAEEGLSWDYHQIQYRLARGYIEAPKVGEIFTTSRGRIRKLAKRIRGET